MRLLVYNIRYGTGGHWVLPWRGYLGQTQGKLSELIAFMRDIDPDVMGLIEVDEGSYRTGKRSQAERIAEELGHYHTYRSKYPEHSMAQHFPVLNKQGNAFLTRDSITGEKFHYFDRGMKRLVIELELNNVVIFLVHLALHFRTRQSQLSELYALVSDIEKPYIVAGDFNARWGEREMRLFQAATGLLNPNDSQQPSYPSRQPKRQLDFILHSRGIRTTRFEMPTVTLSDHLPLVLDFEIESAMPPAPAPLPREPARV